MISRRCSDAPSRVSPCVSKARTRVYGSGHARHIARVVWHAPDAPVPQITGYPDPIALAAGEDTRVRTGDGDVRDAGERTHPPVYRGACTTNAWEMRAMSSLLPEPEGPYRTPRFVRDDRCHVMGIVAACVVAASQPNVHQETAGGSGGLIHQPPGVSACSSLCRQQRAPGRSYSTASCNRGIPSRCRSECVAILSHLGRNCRWACYHNTPRQRSHTDVAVLPGILSRGCMSCVSERLGPGATTILSPSPALERYADV